MSKSLQRRLRGLRPREGKKICAAANIERRLGALGDGGKMSIFAADDRLLLAELANTVGLHRIVQTGTSGDQPVLLVPEAEEAAIRKVLRKLGYIRRRLS